MGNSVFTRDIADMFVDGYLHNCLHIVDEPGIKCLINKKVSCF